MEYPKINSLFKRNEKDHSFIIGDYSCPEFNSIKQWRVEEKIDGTNVRIVYDPTEESINIYGRSKDSKMPDLLSQFLKDYFTIDKLKSAFPELKSRCILYGEGFGGYIQSAGKNYQENIGFMLFDILVDRWWLAHDTIETKASLLQIPVPPILGTMSEKEIIEFILSKPTSNCSKHKQIMEGVVARSEPMMLFRNGKPIIWKLKVKDF